MLKMESISETRRVTLLNYTSIIWYGNSIKTPLYVRAQVAQWLR